MNRTLFWPAIGVCGAGLCLVNFWMIQHPPRLDPIVTGEGTGVILASGPIGPVPVPVTMQLDQALARPVFLPTRLPWQASPDVEPAVSAEAPAPAPEQEAVTTQASPPAEIAFLGVGTDSRGSRALLMPSGATEAQWVREGEVVGGWTVLKIETGSIRISASGQNRDMQLYPSTAGLPR